MVKSWHSTTVTGPVNRENATQSVSAIVQAERDVVHAVAAPYTRVDDPVNLDALCRVQEGSP